jgi:hypothetical protein
MEWMTRENWNTLSISLYQKYCCTDLEVRPMVERYENKLSGKEICSGPLQFYYRQVLSYTMLSKNSIQWIFKEICDSCGEDDSVSLLGCNAVSTYRYIQTFWRNVLPPSSEMTPFYLITNSKGQVKFKRDFFCILIPLLISIFPISLSYI